MKSILLIIPYFGKWPVWFDAHLISIAKNPSINWICPTDCEIPKYYPENIKFIKTTLDDLNEKFNEKLNANISLNIRKFCDLKPTYGYVFEEEVIGYDFWGICDMDLIWGDIREFMTEEILSSYEIISSRNKAISGHFNLFRNTSRINEMFKAIKGYKHMLEKSKLVIFDEIVLTNHLLNLLPNENKILWTKILCNQEKGLDSHQEYYLDRWLWKDGKMFDTSTQEEVMYLHFINWKRTMNYCEINYDDNPNQFYISYTGMHYKLHSKFDYYINDLKNIFNGYWIKEKRRYRIIRIKSLKKRVKRKLKLF